MSSSDIVCTKCAKQFQMNELMINGRCGHETCSQCLVNHVTTNIKLKIKCPIDGCENKIFDKIIRKCLSNDEITVFDELSIIGSTSQLKKCPIEECPFMYICKSDTGIFDCGYCESPICVKCDDIHLPQDCPNERINKATTSRNKDKEDITDAKRIIGGIIVCLLALLIGVTQVPNMSQNWLIFIIIILVIMLVPLFFSVCCEWEPGVVVKKQDNVIIQENKPSQSHTRAIDIITKKRRQEALENDQKYDLLPNPNSYTCMFCSDFILPREGVILRNCLHCFCGNCLKEAYSIKEFIRQLRCQICNVKLQNKELRVLIEEKRFVSMIIDEASYLLYHCKSEDCERLLDVPEGTTSFECPNCASINCLVCHDIHTGVSCDDFQKSKKYLEGLTGMEILKRNIHINCHHCKTLLIQNGGCGALSCTNCGNSICVFTGLFAGQHDPKICGCWASESCERQHNYCQCTSAIPCHAKCEYGCYPE